MSNVIRRENQTSSSPFSFADVERQAQKIIHQARLEAQRIIGESETRVRAVTEAHKQEGYKAGIAEGRQAGFDQARQEAREKAIRDAATELNQLTNALSTGLAEFEQQKRTLLARAETGLIELAIAIARRVCKLHIQADPSVAHANAHALVELVAHNQDLELRVNPAEHELLPIDVAELAREVEQLGHVKIVPDESVAPGGCRLHTRDGTIDANIDEQLDRIAAALATHHPTAEPAPDETDA